MNSFITGLELSEAFYKEVVKPILDSDFLDLKYSAALIGWGSEVLGFDTAQSTDHHWGPRLHLFLSGEDYFMYKGQLKETLGNKLPFEFRGISTNFSQSGESGIQLLEKTDQRPVNHHIYIHTIKDFVEERLRVDPFGEITALDWLTFSEQRLLEITAGKVFHDGLDKLNKVRRKFQFYPHEVWLYLLASQWLKISQEEAFVGRCGDAGDEVGSRIVTARIIRDLMKLCFLIEKKYAPYNKWLGTAFMKLKVGPGLYPIFEAALASANWKDRESYLAKVYEIIARKHNELGITKSLDPHVSSYHERPYLVINADRFVKSIKENLKEVKIDGGHRYIGSVNQFIDSADLLLVPELLKKLKGIYEG